MGLFGADWSWDEWQKKEEVYNELDKQTNKLINGLKQQQDEREYQQYTRERIDAINAYANSLTNDDRRLIRRIPKEARKLSSANIRTNILTLTPNWSAVQTNSYIRLLKLILVPIFLFCLIFNPFEKAAHGDLYLLFNIMIWINLYRIPLNIIQAIYSFISIMRTNCFKELVKELQEVNFKNVEYLGVGATCIRIIEKSGSKKNINYSKYDFPDLPYTKYGILLAALMWRFGLIFRYRVKCMAYRRDHTCYLYGLGDRGVNVDFGCDKKVFSEGEQNVKNLELFNYSVYAERIIFPWEKLKNNLNNFKESETKRKEESKKRKQGKTW